MSEDLEQKILKLTAEVEAADQSERLRLHPKVQALLRKVTDSRHSAAPRMRAAGPFVDDEPEDFFDNMPV